MGLADRAGRGRRGMTSLALLSVAGGHSGTVHRRTGPEWSDVALFVVAALGASLAPTLKKSSPNGLDETPEAFGPFKPEAELTNGRGAMVGLVSLLVVEHFTKGALFGFF